MVQGNDKQAVHEGKVERAISLCINGDAIDDHDDHPAKLADMTGYCEPEELAEKILVEMPDAIELYSNLEDMIEYIRVAMAANYVFPHPTSQRN